MKKYIRPPRLTKKGWIIEITEGISPLSKVIETVQCESQPAAFQAYRQIMKDMGRGF